MAWYTALFLLAGLAIVVCGADEAIKRLLGLSKFLRLSAFVTGVVIAGNYCGITQVVNWRSIRT